MYNRYIPSADGTYRRQTVSTQSAQTPAIQEEPNLQNTERGFFPFLPSLDSNDLLVLAVILLVLQNSDGQDRMSALITLTAFLFLN